MLAESAGIVRCKALYGRAESHRCADDVRIACNPRRDLVAAHEPIRIGAVVRPTWKLGRPVRGDQGELVPPVLPGAAECVTALDDLVLAARLD